MSLPTSIVIPQSLRVFADIVSSCVGRRFHLQPYGWSMESGYVSAGLYEDFDAANRAVSIQHCYRRSDLHHATSINLPYDNASSRQA
jgi:hypothetical protein